MKKKFLAAIIAVALSFTATAQRELTSNFELVIPIAATFEQAEDRMKHLDNVFYSIRQDPDSIYMTLYEDGVEKKAVSFIRRTGTFLYMTKDGDINFAIEYEPMLSFLNLPTGWVITYSK